jgi:hypothetical protein
MSNKDLVTNPSGHLHISSKSRKSPKTTTEHLEHQNHREMPSQRSSPKRAPNDSIPNPGQWCNFAEEQREIERFLDFPFHTSYTPLIGAKQFPVGI